jgi:hypothetical protein
MKHALALAAIALSACSSGGSSGGATHAASLAQRATGTMHVVLTTPVAATYDLSNATCLVAARGEAGGGLHVAGSGTAGLLAATVDDSRSAGDDTDAWIAPANAATLDAPVHVRLRLPDGAIFSGGAGSSAQLEASGGGSTGKIVFTNATYAGKSGVSDAGGTITWSCTKPGSS